MKSLLAIARELFPSGYPFLLGREVRAGKASRKKLPEWSQLEPADERSFGHFETYAIRKERLAKPGGYALHWIPEGGWDEAQAWALLPPEEGDDPEALRSAPAAGYAVCTPLQIASGAMMYVVRDTPFARADVRALVVAVGLYDPDRWRAAFLARAAEVLGVGGPGSNDGEFEPQNAERLFALVEPAERGLDGAAAFDALRTRWHDELLAYARSLRAAGAIRMGEGELTDYYGLGNFSGMLADGYPPTDALEEDRSYWSV